MDNRLLPVQFDEYFGQRLTAAQLFSVPPFEKVGSLFDFIKRGEHALVDLNPHFVLESKYARIMALFVHAVYGSDDFYAHPLLPNK